MLESHQDAAKCFICRKIFTQKLAKDKNHQKVIFTGKYRGNEDITTASSKTKIY